MMVPGSTYQNPSIAGRGSRVTIQATAGFAARPRAIGHQPSIILDSRMVPAPAAWGLRYCEPPGDAQPGGGVGMSSHRAIYAAIVADVAVAAAKFVAAGFTG